MAEASQLKHFFDYQNAGDFMRDWKALSEDEKKWFKEELQKEIDAGRWASA